MSYTIPQIPVTALSALIDDFVELGGVSGGSRKILASSFVLTTDPRLDALGTVTSVNASGGATGMSFTGGPVTVSGSLTLGGTLAATSGGTGLTLFNTGDLIQASNSTTLSKLAAVAAGNVLLSGGVNTISSWGKVGIGTHVSGLGTGVAAALAVAVGSAGAPVVFGGALGTPTSGTATNLSGTASGLTAGTVTTNANLTGDVLSVGNATNIAAGVIVDADINAGAAIADTKLATISTASKVSNSATTATSANVINAIVARDGSGNFSANTISGTSGVFTALSAVNSVRVTANATIDGPSSALDYISGKARVWSWGPDVSTVGTFAVRLARSNGSNASEPLTVTSTGTTVDGSLLAGSLLLSPFALSAASSSVLRFSGTQAASVLQGFDGTNAYGITLYNGATPNVVLQSNGASSFAGGINSTPLGAGGASTVAATTISASGQISGNLTGTVTGNAATATKFATPRTITITGDLAYTSPNFDGSDNVTAVGTLVNVATAGTTGGSTAIPIITINAKGLTTSISTAVVVAPAGTLTGATLAAGVTASSLTSVGTLTGLTTSGQITSNVAIGTAPFVVTSTTNVINLNASSLNGATAETANTANKIVARDISGNFAAGTITASLTGTASDVLNSAVIAKVLTGYSSGAGVVAAADTILQAIQKLNGNDGNLQPLDAALTALATGSDFVNFSGPTTSVKTFTLPNANAALVAGTASTTVGRLASFNNTLGTGIQDSGVLASDVVVQGGNATLSIAAITQLKLAPELGYATTGSIVFNFSFSRSRIVLTGNLIVSSTTSRANDASSVLELYNPTANSLTLGWSLLTSWKTNGNGSLPTTIPPGQTFQFLFQCWGTTESTVSINFITPLNRKEFNVRDYGATGDYNGASGGTADEAAINAAAAALVASDVGGCLYFPAGRYKKTTKLTMSLGNVLDGLTIKGDGPGASQIVFVGADLGIVITVATPQQEGFLNHTPVDVMDLAIATQELSGAGTAFVFNGAKSSAGVRALRISNVLIRGFATVQPGDLIQSWDSCISVTSAEGVFINNVYASVGTLSADTFIVKYNNGNFGPCSILDIGGCSFQGSDKCVWVVGTDGPEGVIVRGTTLVNVNWGVYWDTTTDEEDLKLSDSHVNAYKGCVYANNLFRSFIHDNNLFVDPSATTGPTNLLRLGGARYGSIHDNFMRAPNPTKFSAPAYVAGTTYVIGSRVSYLSNEYTSLVNSNTGNTPSSSPAQWSPDHVGVRLASQTGVHITDNIFQRFGTDVVLENGSDYNTVVDNRSFNNSEVAVAFTFTDAGTSNVVDCQGSTTWDPASLVSGQQDFVNISCPGVKFGAQCTVGVPYDVQNMFVQATVTSANTVRVAVYNSSGGTVNLGSGTWTVRAINPGP